MDLQIIFYPKYKTKYYATNIIERQMSKKHGEGGGKEKTDE